MQFGPYPDTLEAALRRRGHRIVGTGNVHRILLPEKRIGEVLQAYWATHGIKRAQRVFSPEVRLRYHELLGQASFRKLARRLILARGQPLTLEQLRENAGERVEEY